MTIENNINNNSNVDMSELSLPVRGTSTTSGNYVFLPYDPKAPTAERGLRTAKVMYKTNTKTNTKAGENSCLLVTPLDSESITNNIDSLLPHIITMCETEQDKIIKALHLAGNKEVEKSLISISAVIESLNEERTKSQRMTKEVIANWFDVSLAESLSVLFADKLGLSETPTNEESEKVEMFVSVYKNKFSGLASNLVNYSIEETDKLLSALDKCSELDDKINSDLVSIKIKTKLVNMKTPVDLAEMLDL